MGLIDLARRHNRAILSNSSTGGAWPVTITNPDGASATVSGWSNDISQIIDPDTGQAVSGRAASLSLSIDDLRAEGLDIPKGQNSRNAKPWLIAWNDGKGTDFLFKISSADPDRTLDSVVCILEAYKNAG